MPLIRLAMADVALKAVEVIEREQRCAQALEPLVDGPVIRRERLQLARVVVEYADCARETELPRTGSDYKRILGIRHACAENGVDSDPKLCHFGEPLQLLVEYPQTLL